MQTLGQESLVLLMLAVLQVQDSCCCCRALPPTLPLPLALPPSPAPTMPPTLPLPLALPPTLPPIVPPNPPVMASIDSNSKNPVPVTQPTSATPSFLAQESAYGAMLDRGTLWYTEFIRWAGIQNSGSPKVFLMLNNLSEDLSALAEEHIPVADWLLKTNQKKIPQSQLVVYLVGMLQPLLAFAYNCGSSNVVFTPSFPCRQFIPRRRCQSRRCNFAHRVLSRSVLYCTSAVFPKQPSPAFIRPFCACTVSCLSTECLRTRRKPASI